VRSWREDGDGGCDWLGGIRCEYEGGEERIQEMSCVNNNNIMMLNEASRSAD
jgi:hypothetical protein